MCPISNVKLGVVPSLPEHPIRHLLDAGVVCTVSTDDPVSFGNTLTDEYMALATGLTFTRAELARVALNGFRVAHCDAELVGPWVSELEALAAQS
jgi:adenosine deaminase